MSGNPSTNERSARSVFVGNIPYDASEERLKDIFSEVGPVLSFKLVYDRESGKPKGYGFCEYRDQETALSAMRNLNQYELNGRNLRVDTATNERFKEEMKNLQLSLTGSTFESPYGQEVDPEKAPEQIAKVVASLPPEQMFELARQMKHCALTNPNEARNMLVQNPQLSYALLQMLVVMKAIDINAASSVLYKPNPAPVNIPAANMGPVPPGVPVNIPHPTAVMQHPQQQQPPPQQMPIPMQFDHPPQMDAFNRGGPPPPVQHPGNFDQRHIDPRMRQSELYDPRVAPPPSVQQAAAPHDPRLRPTPQQPPIDPRHIQQQQAVPPPGPPGIRGPAPGPPGPPQAPPAVGGRFGPPPTVGTGGSAALPGPAGQPEEEKTALIMQVLALSDQQIALLPPDQRHSIIQLKEQLTRGGQP